VTRSVALSPDLQWADELTLGLLDFLARDGQPAGARVLVVGTYRSEEQPEALRALGETGRVARVGHTSAG
jgi:hypothetical protein